ncbi:uncharacterized protein CTRU02_206958 [Colletotrichum truncatum]|uniref:Uncharacterized protein n=1 Tax=Colletotrichum truncatum TaxID=5467 RepID=A0ACC3YZ95_COLTU
MLTMYQSICLGRTSAALCNNNLSILWKCVRPNGENSGYTASCCPRDKTTFQQDGACCTENWSAFKSCCQAHSGYTALSG